MRIALVAFALVGGCFTDAPGNGALKCNYSGGRICPSGFDCAADRRCYRLGQLPDLAGADLEPSDAAVDDLSSADLAGADLSLVDLSSCEGLSCLVPQCGIGVHTSLSGQVRDPSGAVPVYNARVFVPGAALTPFVDGPSCAPCSELVSGAPIVSTRTAVDGTFRLDEVPAGDNIPLVIQVGKWRRLTTLSTVNPCVDNAVPSDQTRLPKNKSEGDIPLHAVTTGNADAIECVLRILGIEDSEFTPPSGNGRVHMYYDNGARLPSPSPSPSPSAMLFNSLPTLQKYDVVMVACTGSPAVTAATPLKNFADYLAGGGRVTVGHHGYTWLTGNATLWPIATWTADPTPTNPPDPATGKITQTTPLKLAFANWLLAAGSAEPQGDITIRQARPLALDVPSTTVDWIRIPLLMPIVALLSAPVPFGAAPEQQCGRVVFADFHTPIVGSMLTFPLECTMPELIQHRALEFAYYDLFACP